MISLRHHAISLAAVFLALTVGVVLGSGALAPALLAGVHEEQLGLQGQVDGLQAQDQALGQRLRAADAFTARVAPRIVHDELAGRSVVVFRTPDAPDDDVDAVSQLVGTAGGRIAGTLLLTGEFVDADAEEKLTSVIESSVVPAGAQLDTKLTDPSAQAGDLLGIALLINRDPRITPAEEAQRDTVLAALRNTGFLAYSDEHVGAADAALVITGGALGDDAGNKGASVARFAAALAPHGSAVVLAGRDGCASDTGAVAVARADGGITTLISTVDDADTAAGRITVIMAAGDLVHGGRTGQYGIGPGADSVTVM